MKNLNYALIFIGVLALVSGIYTGVIRIGQPLPDYKYLPIAHHGLLMAGPFLGILFALERVLNYKKKRFGFIPALMALSLPALLLGYDDAGAIMLILGSLGYGFISIMIYFKERNLGNLVIMIAAAFQFFGYVIYLLTHSYPNAFASWMLFVILSILGKRMILNPNLGKEKMALYELYAWLLLFFISTLFYHYGLKIVEGVSILGLAQWFFRYDLKTMDFSKSPAKIYYKSAFILAYIWLAVSGVLSMLEAGNPFLYDALLHSLFIGFVFSVIFAHGAIVYPEIFGLKSLPYHPILYLVFGGLQISLILRVYGDMAGNMILRKQGGIYNGLFLAIYILVMLYLMLFRRNKYMVRFDNVDADNPKNMN